MSKGEPTREDEARFQRLLEDYGKFLRNVIAQTCPRNLGIQINDIEQEARLRLWRAIRSERELTDAASYIYRIAVTTTIDAVRRVLAKREQQFSLEGEDREIDEVGLLAADIEQSPERVAERRELVDKIESALARMSENRRVAVEFYLEGMSSQELADLMGWSEPKARNLIYRGLNDLRKHLKAEGIDY